MSDGFKDFCFFVFFVVPMLVAVSVPFIYVLGVFLGIGQ